MANIPSPFAESNLGIDFNYTDVGHAMAELGNWTERYKLLFQLVNRINSLDETYKIDNNLIEECESPVWLLHHHYQDHHYFVADSDSKVIRGLLVIILCCCNGKHRDEILQLELELILKQLDLGKYLTPSRSNGLMSVMKQIKKSVN